jgi:hypothetical protein
MSSHAVIEELLKIHATLMNCRSFLTEQHRKAIFKGFKNSLNFECSRAAFLMARYCHSEILANPGTFIREIDEFLLLFRELNSMDEFIQSHRDFLSIRLLSYAKRVPPIENELVRKIAAICGEDEVRRLEKMLEDTALSIDLEYDSSPSPFPFRVLVISFDSWPIYPNVQLRVPREVLDARSNFVNFYKAPSCRQQPNRQVPVDLTGTSLFQAGDGSRQGEK